MYYVYVLFCQDRAFYIGYTSDLKTRITAHNNGHVHSTKLRQPIKLIYYECYLDPKDARAREKFLKSGGGHREFKKQHQNLLKILNYRYL